jgi:cephalosporin hydroxylase
MKLIIDTDEKSLHYSDDKLETHMELYSTQAFELLSHIWLKVGWNQKYVYTFSWMGRPIIQLPDDLLRIQEVIYRIQPDVIIETGIAHGGSLVFYASLLRAIGRGRVIGIDIEIRPHNQRAIEAHELFPLITLVEGSSIDPEIVSQVKGMVRSGERVLVILDSNHTYKHVLAELEAYHSLVTPESYIVATDGIMHDVHDTPRGKLEWALDNPAAAAREFANRHPEFILERPEWEFNESELMKSVTHWADAWLKKI